MAVIEAGLGGRYDATNVIPSKVQVLTSVGLEHTRWLGPTIDDIAQEKLDVVQPGGDARARRRAASRRARAGAVGRRRARRPGRAGGHRPGDRTRSARRRSSDATSRWREAAAEAYLGALDADAVRRGGGRGARPGPPPDRRRAAADAARRRPQPGRNGGAGGVAAGDHGGARSASSAWSRSSTTRMRRGCWRSCCPTCDALVFTSSQNPRALPPPTLQSLSRQLARSAVRDRARSAGRGGARARAGRRGRRRHRDRLDLPVADLLRARRQPARLDAVNDDDDQPELPDDDRARRADRGGRDPGLLRNRLPVRPGIPVNALTAWGHPFQRSAKTLRPLHSDR